MRRNLLAPKCKKHPRIKRAYYSFAIDECLKTLKLLRCYLVDLKAFRLSFEARSLHASSWASIVRKLSPSYYISRRPSSLRAPFWFFFVVPTVLKNRELVQISNSLLLLQ